MDVAPPVVAHTLLEAWDPRAALLALARGVLRRPISSVDARHWFTLWPAIPEPALYVSVHSALTTTEACAA